MNAGNIAHIDATREDEALAQAAKDEWAAFEILYRRFVGRVYRYCYTRTNDAQAAEDLTAQTFLSAMEGIGRYSRRGSFAAWLFGIASNVCKGYHRYGYRHRQEPLSEAAQLVDFDTPAPEQRAYRHDILDCALRVMPQLSEDRQEVLRLRFLAGLSTAETAAVMGRRQGAVRTLLSRAIDDLRERCLDG